MAEQQRKANVLALVQRFEKWSQEAQKRDETDVSTDEDDDESYLDGIDDPAERERLRAERKAQRKEAKREARRKAKAAPGKLDEARKNRFAATASRDERPAAAPKLQTKLSAAPNQAATAKVTREPTKEVDADIVAYWDEETETYWYTDDATGKNYWWDEDAQEYKSEEEEGYDEDDEAAGGETYDDEETPPAGDGRKRLGVRVEGEQVADSAVFVPTDPELLKRVALDIGLDVALLERLEKGLKAYAFVKANGGMLKPLRLHYRAGRGKLYIIRNNRSQYLHVMHFGEVNKSAKGLEELTKDPTTGDTPLEGQPHIVIYTNDVYHQATKRKKHFRMPRALKAALGKQAAANRKSLLFVLEEFEERDELFEAICKSAKLLKTDLKVVA